MICQGGQGCKGEGGVASEKERLKCTPLLLGESTMMCLPFSTIYTPGLQLPYIQNSPITLGQSWSPDLGT